MISIKLKNNWFYKIMSEIDPKGFLGLISLIVFSSLFEVFGTVIFLPYLELLFSNSKTENNLFNKYLSLFSNTKDMYIYTGYIVFSIVVFSQIIRGFTARKILKFSIRAERILNSRLLKLFLDKGLKEFNSANTSDYSRAILLDVQQITYNGLIPFLNLILQVSVALIFLTITLWIFFYQTIFLLILLFISFGVVKLFFDEKVKLQGIQRDLSNSNRMILISESLQSYREIKIYRLKDFILNSFNNTARKYENSQVFSQSVGLITKFVIEGLAFSILVIVLLWKTYTDSLDPSFLLVMGNFVIVVYKILPSFQQIFYYLNLIKYTETARHNLLELINDEKKIELKTQGEVAFSKEINLNNISFAYSDKTILESINLKISKGSKIGIIGKSGSGKSTLTDLVCGFHLPNSGSITIDGISLSENNIDSWHRKIGYVPQDFNLFDVSIAENVAPGLLPNEIDIKGVLSCLNQVGLENFLSTIEGGVWFKVGDNGNKLSGGQKQRIAIARALYKNPQVIIFDESSSALDRQSENELASLISNILPKDLTIIIITHGDALLKCCNEVYEVDNMKIKKIIKTNIYEIIT